MKNEDMQKPSKQFVEKLENDLRMAYRGQYSQSPVAHPVIRFFKFFVPAVSGALVLVLILWNLKGNIAVPGQKNNNNNTTTNNQQNIANIPDTNLETFDEGSNEEQVVQNFDDDELTQIDNSVKLVAEGNY